MIRRRNYLIDPNLPRNAARANRKSRRRVTKMRASQPETRTRAARSNLQATPSCSQRSKKVTQVPLTNSRFIVTLRARMSSIYPGHRTKETSKLPGLASRSRSQRLQGLTRATKMTTRTSALIRLNSSLLMSTRQPRSAHHTANESQSFLRSLANR